MILSMGMGMSMDMDMDRALSLGSVLGSWRPQTWA